MDRWLFRAGLTVIGSALALVGLAYLRPLYQQPVPGDEGGLAFLFTILAASLLPVGLLLVVTGLLARFRSRNEATTPVRAIATIALGVCVWCCIRVFVGSIYAGPWPLIAGTVSALAAWLWLRG